MCRCRDYGFEFRLSLTCEHTRWNLCCDRTAFIYSPSCSHALTASLRLNLAQSIRSQKQKQPKLNVCIQINRLMIIIWKWVMKLLPETYANVQGEIITTAGRWQLVTALFQLLMPSPAALLSLYQFQRLGFICLAACEPLLFFSFRL